MHLNASYICVYVVKDICVREPRDYAPIYRAKHALDIATQLSLISLVCQNNVVNATLTATKIRKKDIFSQRLALHNLHTYTYVYRLGFRDSQ